MESNSGKTLTIAGMILTAVLSIGGSYVSNLVSDGEQEVRLVAVETRSEDNSEWKSRVVSLEASRTHAISLHSTMDAHIAANSAKINAQEVRSAKATAVLENLVKATNRLAESTNSLMITVTQLQENTKK